MSNSRNVYLTNTNNHHDKFYHMIENKDGTSFTASWGMAGSNSRTKIYNITEWDKIYTNKINKGYKIPTNGTQGMSVAQRKKQGITTVQPLVQPKKAKKKPKDVEVYHPHQDKLKILRTAMENFQHGEGRNLPMDSKRGRLFEADLYKVDELLIEGKEILTKEEMVDMNTIFKTYGGKRC